MQFEAIQRQFFAAMQSLLRWWVKKLVYMTTFINRLTNFYSSVHKSFTLRHKIYSVKLEPAHFSEHQRLGDGMIVMGRNQRQ